MASHRSKLSLPVKQDDRSFEEHQQDLLERMQQALNLQETRAPEDNMIRDDFFYDRMSQKMLDQRGKWEENIRQMREEFLQLSPKNTLSSNFSSFSNSPIPWSNNGPPMSPSSMMSSRSSTLNSSRSSTLNSRTGAMSSPSGTLTSRSGTLRSMNDCLEEFQPGLTIEPSPPSFHRGEDGQIHYRVYIDVKDFKPNDITVAAKNNKLSVSVKHEHTMGSTTSTQELSRTLDLPPNVDKSQLTCNVTTDGILMLDAPVSCPKYEPVPETLPSSQPNIYVDTTPVKCPSIGYFSSCNSTPKSSVSQMDSAWGSTLTALTNQDHRLYLEVPIGQNYTAEEIDIKTQDQKLYIHARHEEGHANKSSSFHEFSKCYDIPANIDPYSINARFENGVLYVQSEGI